MITHSFIFLAGLAIASALAVVFNKNAVNSALFLVIHLISLAGMVLLLLALFFTIVQVLVYWGAILVVFLFIIMMLNVDDVSSLFNKFRLKYFFAFLLGAGVFAQILYSIGSFTDTLPLVSEEMAQAGTVEAVGEVLFTDYLLPFELTAILLTAAVVGALLVAQHNIKPVSGKDD